jgi:hypothetical protein
LLARLKDNAERALGEAEGAVANRALELLGKQIGMFIERRVTDSTVTVQDRREAELRAIQELFGPEAIARLRLTGSMH